MINKERTPEYNQEQAEIFSEIFITKVKSGNIESDSESNTAQMVQYVIDGKYEADEIRDELQKYEIDRAIKENLYILIADSIIERLENKVVRLRQRSQRSISASRMKTREKTKGDKKRKTTRKPSKKEEDDKYKVQKMSMEEIGEEIAKREEEGKKLLQEREEEEKEILGEQTKHAAAYQGAFNIYADYIILIGKEVKGIDSLVSDIGKLGNPDLSNRQMAIDKIINNSNISLAYYPLIAGLNDKVIINKVIQAVGKLEDFRIVEVLIEVFMDNFGEKGSGIRGLSAQAIGNVIKALNQREKLLGTKKLFKLIKHDSFEKKLESVIPNLNRDIKKSHMRKYYYSKSCLQMLLLLSNKLIELKKKDVKAAFIKLRMQTPLSKMLKETSMEIEAVLKG